MSIFVRSATRGIAEFARDWMCLPRYECHHLQLRACRAISHSPGASVVGSQLPPDIVDNDTSSLTEALKRAIRDVASTSRLEPV